MPAKPVRGKTFSKSVNKADAALFKQGIIYRLEGLYDKSLECFDRIIERNALSVKAFVEKSNTLRVVKNFDEATALATHALEMNSHNLLAQYNLLRAQNPSTEGQIAKGLMEPIITASPRTIDDYIAQSRAWMVVGSHDNAASVLIQATKKYPSNVFIHYHLGVIYQSGGKYAAAENIFRITTNIDCNMFLAWYNLGVALAKQGSAKYLEAENAFKHALSCAPNKMNAIYGLIHIYYAQGKYEDALEFAQSESRDNPNDGYLHSWLSSILLKMGMRDQNNEYYKAVLTECAEALKHLPNNIIVHCNKGQALYALGHKKEAREELTKAHELYLAHKDDATLKDAGHNTLLDEFFSTEDHIAVLGKIKSLAVQALRDVVISSHDGSEHGDSVDGRFKQKALATNAVAANIQDVTQKVLDAAMDSVILQSNIAGGKDSISPQEILTHMRTMFAQLEKMSNIMEGMSELSRAREEIRKDTELEEYYYGVVNTLASHYIASQGATSGITETSSHHWFAEVASVFAEAIPVFGPFIGRGITGISRLVMDSKIKRNATVFNQLASNVAEFDDLIMKATVNILIAHPAPVKSYINDKEVMHRAVQVVTKLSTKCSAAIKSIYGDTYNTIPKQVGHADALYFIHRMETGEFEIRGDRVLSVQREIFHFLNAEVAAAADLKALGAAIELLQGQDSC